MDLLFCVVDCIGVVEPAVIGVLLLAVHHRVAGIIGLRQLVPVLHFNYFEKAALFFTFVFLFPSSKGQALNTFSEENSFLVSSKQIIKEEEEK